MTTSSATHSERMQSERLREICTWIRHWILKMTTQAGSGHPTSSLSAVELMTGLFFDGHFRFDVDNPAHPNNDRLIFSKGHASPLMYALWAAAGQVSEAELMSYRDFESDLEGHPTSNFRFTEAATGSLGQGLSIGVGMALNAQLLDQASYRTFVLLGDSEMSEGSQWEAIQTSAYYRLTNLIAVLDVNRLGQRGETMLGDDLSAYQRRVEAFGWRTVLVQDGNDIDQVTRAYGDALAAPDGPTMIIANTIKGKGVRFLEDQNGWHGKPLDSAQLEEALEQLGPAHDSPGGQLARPGESNVKPSPRETRRQFKLDSHYSGTDEVATRDAFGKALCELAPEMPDLVALDAEVSNSTRSKSFRDSYPDRFFEMFVAEQNMVGTALGLSQCGKVPFISTFAAFLTRAYDQIRLSPYSNANLKFIGSHAGVSIGQDGPSQMGLEDIAMFRSILDSVVLCPCDAVSTVQLVAEMAAHVGVSYMRTMRGKTPVLYKEDDNFCIGGSRVLRQTLQDQVTLVAAGVTVHEAMEAHAQLSDEGILTRVIDVYSIKPIDGRTLRAAADDTGHVITIEDHFAAGGIGEAVHSELANSQAKFACLAVHLRPRSGTPRQLRKQQGIDAASIVAQVKQLLG